MRIYGRKCRLRLFLLLGFILFGLFSYQFDLFNTIFHKALLKILGKPCLHEPNSYVILMDLTQSKDNRLIEPASADRLTDPSNSNQLGELSTATGLRVSEKSDRCREPDRVCKRISITGGQLGIRFHGLGNQMFMLASIFGIGKTIGADLIVGCDNMPKLEFVNEFSGFTLNRSKKLFNEKNKYSLVISAVTPVIGKCCAYRNITDQLLRIKSADLIIIDGFLQSWKYFDHWKTDVRKMFTFRESIVAQASKDFHRLIDRSKSEQIGCVHVRRGDLLRIWTRNKGYIHGDSKNVNAAVRFLNKTLALKGTPFKILLFSDDPGWCQSEFSGSRTNSPVLAMGDQSASVGLETMSRYCDGIFLVSSTSTFGWWAAYLSKRGAQVFYNRQLAISGSSVEGETVPEDFFLPDWVSVDLAN